MKRATISVAGFWLLLALVCGAAHSHESQEGFPQTLFACQQIFNAGDEIALSAEQRQTIESLDDALQADMAQTKQAASAESEKLMELINAAHIDEAAAMSSVDKMLDLQREAQRAQIRHLIDVRNVLTETQQAQLIQLRSDAEATQ